MLKINPLIRKLETTKKIIKRGIENQTPENPSPFKNFRDYGFGKKMILYPKKKGGHWVCKIKDGEIVVSKIK